MYVGSSSPVIDLHCHILPGLDDGPATVEDSLALADRAVAGGTRTIVATPHIREDHPFELERIADGVEDLNSALAGASVPLEVMTGGEVAINRAVVLGDDDLRKVALGSGAYLLVESPYVYVSDLLEHAVSDLQERGFRPLLAHPERSPCFQSRIERLGRLVDDGALCSITAGSLAGRFGRTVKRFSVELLAAGLVHDIASDAHNAGRRPPLDRRELDEAEQHISELRGRVEWLVQDAPAAILRGEDLPPLPAPAGRGQALRDRMAGLFRRA